MLNETGVSQLVCAAGSQSKYKPNFRIEPFEIVGIEYHLRWETQLSLPRPALSLDAPAHNVFMQYNFDPRSVTLVSRLLSYQ